MENCAYCDEFVCEKVGRLLSSREGMLVFCRPEGDPVSEEEYDLCMGQFDSFSNVVRMLAETGRLGKWVREEPER